MNMKVTGFALILMTLAGLGQVSEVPMPDQSKADAVVATVIQRCLARDITTSDSGIKLIRWIPPSAEDYRDIGEIGHLALGPLTAYLESRDDFEELLAVKFLESLRDSATTQPLKSATASGHWVVVRLSALDALWNTATDEDRSWVTQMRNDSDPLVAKRVNEFISLTPVH